MSCSNVQIEYDGNGVRVDYTFPFTYEDELEVHVATWDESLRYIDVERDTWSFQNATTIRFTEAPEGKFIIYRKTDLEEMEVTFYPGSSIRAQDLNANFEQLRDAIQEGWCRVSEEFYEYLDKYIWDTRDAITYDDQLNGRWGKAEERLSPRIATSDAIAARSDVYMQDNKPAELPYEQPGKRWYDTNIPNNYIWNGDIKAWIDYARTGPQGPKGEDGHHQVIIGLEPPTERPSGDPIGTGDIWFDNCKAEAWIYYDGHWLTLVNSGPQGPKGSDGQDGQDGQDGSDGEDGKDGNPGQVICSLSNPETRDDGSELQCGDQWFNTCNGELYVYYDGNWLGISDATGPEGPQGKPGPTGPPGTPGTQVWIGDTPPTSTEVFPLWFDTKCPVGLYAWDDEQWVAVSTPGPTGPVGPQGPQGEQGEQGEPGFGFCALGDTPPAGPDVGDLWFDTGCPSGLYVWSGDEWVGTSIPGPRGPAGGGGGDLTALQTESPIEFDGTDTVSFSLTSLTEI